MRFLALWVGYSHRWVTTCRNRPINWVTRRRCTCHNYIAACTLVLTSSPESAESKCFAVIICVSTHTIRSWNTDLQSEKYENNAIAFRVHWRMHKSLFWPMLLCERWTPLAETFCKYDLDFDLVTTSAGISQINIDAAISKQLFEFSAFALSEGSD